MIETNRLILRTFNNDDLNDMLDYLNQELPHCFFDMKVNSIHEAKNMLIKKIKDDFCFAITLKETHKVIGELFGILKDDKETYSVCWILNDRYQNKGYAFEAVKAYFSYLFNVRGIRRIYAYTEIDNISSQKLCEKLTMRKEGVFIDFISFVKDENDKPIYETTIQYAILKKEWNFN